MFFFWDRNHERFPQQQPGPFVHRQYRSATASRVDSSRVPVGAFSFAENTPRSSLSRRSDTVRDRGHPVTSHLRIWACRRGLTSRSTPAAGATRDIPGAPRRKFPRNGHRNGLVSFSCCGAARTQTADSWRVTRTRSSECIAKGNSGVRVAADAACRGSRAVGE